MGYCLAAGPGHARTHVAPVQPWQHAGGEPTSKSNDASFNATLPTVPPLRTTAAVEPSPTAVQCIAGRTGTGWLSLWSS